MQIAGILPSFRYECVQERCSRGLRNLLLFLSRNSCRIRVYRQDLRFLCEYGPSTETRTRMEPHSVDCGGYAGAFFDIHELRYLLLSHVSHNQLTVHTLEKHSKCEIGFLEVLKI